MQPGWDKIIETSFCSPQPVNNTELNTGPNKQKTFLKYMGCARSQFAQLLDERRGSGRRSVDEMHCELAGGEFERFKENFAAPHGETYTVTIKAGKNTGFTVQTGGEGQCMKFMVVGVIPDSQAHVAGVAPGCTVVKVNGTNVRSVNELMPSWAAETSP